MKKYLGLLLLFFPLNLFSKASESSVWGFYAHQYINRTAVFTLPPEMFSFYKHHIQFITENAVNPDKRRYAVEGEAEKHFIDVDVYGDSAIYLLPRYWNKAVEKYSEDTLRAYGIVPWHVCKMKLWLTKAFQEKDVDAILRLSADLGHYIADANVPLHTTKNYNGQLTGQHGIHGFWESRLPELYTLNYDFFVGKATYLEDSQLAIWKCVEEAHLALDSVFLFERQLTVKFGEKKYSYEDRNGVITKVYSKEFSDAYHKMLDGQVERRMRASVKMVGDFWYTCWVDAGQPDLTSLLNLRLTEEQQRQMEEERKVWQEQKNVLVREHEN